jgi:membrane-associated protease RseP (regulator of RpoE activity)
MFSSIATELPSDEGRLRLADPTDAEASDAVRRPRPARHIPLLGIGVGLVGLLMLSVGHANLADAQDDVPPGAPTVDSGGERSSRMIRVQRNLPDGYLGITFTCRARQSSGPDGLTIYHYGYPVVASVEPGSPAEAAGILAGDTILAYDSQSVLYRRIVLAKLLRPGTRLGVRVSRNGTLKDLEVRVTRRPPTFVDMSAIGANAPPDPGPPLPPLAPSISRPANTASYPLPPAPPRGIGAPDGAPDAAVALEFHALDGPSAGAVAGAEVVRTNADLRDALGVDGGLLVIQVTDGTAAAEAGIRSGDVIVSVDGSTVDAPITLARAIARAQTDDQTVSLRVIRRHKTRTVVVR